MRIFDGIFIRTFDLIIFHGIKIELLHITLFGLFEGALLGVNLTINKREGNYLFIDIFFRRFFIFNEANNMYLYFQKTRRYGSKKDKRC